MRVRGFLNVVPKTVQVWAAVLPAAGALIGLTAGRWFATPGLTASGHLLRVTLECGGAGLAFGIFFAVWLLCLGFIYADARQRLMRPVLWVLVAIMVPHLLGFLLYFVLRQPIAAPCTHCGQVFPASQRFCSWCGTPRDAPSLAPRGMVVE